jgi:hypothetical protein
MGPKLTRRPLVGNSRRHADPFRGEVFRLRWRNSCRDRLCLPLFDRLGPRRRRTGNELLTACLDNAPVKPRKVQRRFTVIQGGLAT